MLAEVCVVAHRSEAVVTEAIASISALRVADCVRMVDHGPDGASLIAAAAACEKFGLRFHGEHDPTNPGFAAGVNRLAQSVEAPWIVLLNPDATIESWPWSESSPRADIVGAEQHDGGRPIRAWGRNMRTRDEIARSWFRYAPKPRGKGFVGGGAMLIRSSVWQALGGFDPTYFMFYEDIDLCLRACAEGFSVEVSQGWTVQHRLGHSARTDWYQALSWSYESARAFHTKHAHHIGGFVAYTVIDSVMRAGVDVVTGNRSRANARARLARSIVFRARRHG